MRSHNASATAGLGGCVNVCVGFGLASLTSHRSRPGRRRLRECATPTLFGPAGRATQLQKGRVFVCMHSLTYACFCCILGSYRCCSPGWEVGLMTSVHGSLAASRNWTCSRPHAAHKFSPSPFFCLLFMKKLLTLNTHHTLLCVCIYIYMYLYSICVFILVSHHISVNASHQDERKSSAVCGASSA